jgi:hypothetical protein
MSLKTVGILAILAWLFLYTGGIVLGTTPYREVINQGTATPLVLVKSWLTVILFYTLSNVAMLCCLSSIIGGICSGSEDISITNLAANGLFIYLVLISGLLLLGTSPFDNPAQAQYTRLAGTSSLFSFMIGYNPKMLSKLISKLEDLTEK